MGAIDCRLAWSQPVWLTTRISSWDRRDLAGCGKELLTGSSGRSRAGGQGGRNNAGSPDGPVVFRAKSGRSAGGAVSYARPNECGSPRAGFLNSTKFVDLLRRGFSKWMSKDGKEMRGERIQTYVKQVDVPDIGPVEQLRSGR